MWWTPDRTGRNKFIRRQLGSISNALDIDLKPYHEFSDNELSRITGLTGKELAEP